LGRNGIDWIFRYIAFQDSPVPYESLCYALGVLTPATSNQVSVRLVPVRSKTTWFRLRLGINDASSNPSLSFNFMAHT
jgi:hypothetical protein